MLNHTPASTSRAQAVGQALLVTFLWSTSWVLIKIGLQASLPALTFAGLRYSLASLCLLLVVLINPAQRQAIRAFSWAVWGQLALLGVVFYTLTQGAQFVGLAFLPATTLTLLFNFSPLCVAGLSWLLGQEAPSPLQWGGLLLAALGAVIYFFPLTAATGPTLGIGVALGGVLANAIASLLGRRVNQQHALSPMVVTALSMGIGGAGLLGAGVAFQGWGQLDWRQWLIIGWLAVINTAFAFTLWNNTLRTLTAVESSVINGTMLPQIALLAWWFLDEPMTLKQMIGIGLVGVGVLIVQVGRYLLNALNSLRASQDQKII